MNYGNRKTPETPEHLSPQTLCKLGPPLLNMHPGQLRPTIPSNFHESSSSPTTPYDILQLWGRMSWVGGHSSPTPYNLNLKTVDPKPETHILEARSVRWWLEEDSELPVACAKTLTLRVEYTIGLKFRD